MRWVFILLLSAAAWAKNNDPANYPLQAHVLKSSTVTAHTRGKVRSNDGTVSRVRMTSTETATEVQIGKTIYTSEQTCSFLKAGMDVSAKLEDKK
ncbi:MAG TPA: hypothetical protein VFP11_08890, partial [Candidatus Angelobacter sp.]|nr:hypothetical protein [Candidatus Angelobacter sp.]